MVDISTDMLDNLMLKRLRILLLMSALNMGFFRILNQRCFVHQVGQIKVFPVLGQLLHLILLKRFKTIFFNYLVLQAGRKS